MQGPLLPRIVHGAKVSDGSRAAAFLSQSLRHYSAAAARSQMHGIAADPAAG